MRLQPAVLPLRADPDVVYLNLPDLAATGANPAAIALIAEYYFDVIVGPKRPRGLWPPRRGRITWEGLPTAAGHHYAAIHSLDRPKPPARRVLLVDDDRLVASAATVLWARGIADDELTAELVVATLAGQGWPPLREPDRAPAVLERWRAARQRPARPLPAIDPDLRARLFAIPDEPPRFGRGDRLNLRGTTVYGPNGDEVGAKLWLTYDTLERAGAILGRYGTEPDAVRAEIVRLEAAIAAAAVATGRTDAVARAFRDGLDNGWTEGGPWPPETGPGRYSGAILASAYTAAAEVVADLLEPDDLALARRFVPDDWYGPNSAAVQGILEELATDGLTRPQSQRIVYAWRARPLGAPTDLAWDTVITDAPAGSRAAAWQALVAWARPEVARAWHVRAALARVDALLDLPLQIPADRRQAELASAVRAAVAATILAEVVPAEVGAALLGAWRARAGSRGLDHDSFVLVDRAPDPPDDVVEAFAALDRAGRARLAAAAPGGTGLRTDSSAHYRWRFLRDGCRTVVEEHGLLPFWQRSCGDLRRLAGVADDDVAVPYPDRSAVEIAEAALLAAFAAGFLPPEILDELLAPWREGIAQTEDQFDQPAATPRATAGG